MARRVPATPGGHGTARPAESMGESGAAAPVARAGAMGPTIGHRRFMEFLEKALQSLERLRRATSARDVGACVGDGLPDLGLSGFALVRIAAPGGRQPGARSVLVDGWPTDWSAVYDAGGFLDTDPILAVAERRVDPFGWEDVRLAAGSGADDAAFFRAAAGAGLNDGIAFPLRRLSAAPAAAVFAGAEPSAGAEARAFLQVLAVNAHKKLTGAFVQAVPGTPAQGVLSRRERECLQWCAEGKTSWEISQILAISQHTADWYLASATRKLGATNRLHAVAEALRRGLIS
tara:strand:+ start:1209 stop:2075 length:867 start_codon:yes stop_codon:yes gene_type:complete